MTDRTNLPATTTAQATSLSTHSSEPPLSDKLSALLTAKDSPVVGPITATALREWLAAPRIDPDLPTAERVENMIARLSLATKERAVSEREAKERLDLYWRALRDVPLVDLGRAFDDILKSATFMPTPAEVRSKAARYTALRNFRHSRAKHLVWLHDTRWTALIPEGQAIAAGELAELKAGLAEQFPSDREQAQ